MYVKFLKLPKTPYWFLRNCNQNASHFSSSSRFNIFGDWNRLNVVRRFIDQPIGYFEYPMNNAESLIGMKYAALHEKDKYYFECLDPKRDRKLVQIFDDLSDSICKIADLAEFLRTMDSDVDIMMEAREICIEMSNIVESLNTDEELYACIKKVSEKGDKFPMTDVEKHIVDLFVFDFELSGIHLPEAERQKVVQYNNCILQTGQQFSTFAAQPRLLEESSVPAMLNQYFRTIDDGSLLVNGYSDIKDEFAREFAYKTFLAPSESQESRLDDVLLYRHKLAQLCGFPSYAHRAVKGSTAGTPEFVLEFLSTLNSKFHDNVRNDIEVMEKAKAAESNQPLAMWDMAYYITKIKRDYLKYDPSKFSPYFSLNSCLEGVNNLFKKLFGITLLFEAIPDKDGWGPDLFRLKVMHYKEKFLGYIYCDFFERVGKPTQDCHYTIKGGRRLADGRYQDPVVVVVLNLPQPANAAPSLLTPQMVENLFHEMGHALHTMLGRAEYQHITGTRCATDFAEVPSVLMEYFASDPRVIRTFAKHYKTQEEIPDDLLKRFCHSKTVCSAVELQTQIFYSVLDFTYHSDETAPGRTTEILSDVQSKYYPVPYVENTAWQLRFSHLVGYGAKYYSYLVSRAIATSIWQMNFISDPFDRRKGEKYHRECLAHGGGKPARLLVEDFLQTKLTPNFLAESLVNEIKNNYCELEAQI